MIEEELVPVPEVDRWRLPYLSRLFSQRKETGIKALKEEKERLDGLINSLLTN